MVEDFLDDVLGDVTVDEHGAERVPPLVRGQVHGLPVLVADVAVLQPPVEGVAVGVSCDRSMPVGVLGRPGEEHRGAVRPAGEGVLLLFGDERLEFIVDRHEGLAFHLVVVVAQVGGFVGSGGDAVAGQAHRVGDPQSAADEDDRGEPVGEVGFPGQVAWLLDLGHHVPGQRAGQPLGPPRVVAGEEHGVCRERVVPAMLADRGEEAAEQPDVGTLLLTAVHPGLQVGEVAFQDAPADLADAGDFPCGQEGREPG